MTNTYLYNNIKNPLNSTEVINEIIDAYASPLFSKAILKSNSSKSEVIVNEMEEDKLYSKLFNTWKHSILTLKPEQIKKAIAKGIYDTSIYKLYDLLKITPDASTRKAVNKFFTQNYSDPEIVTAINKYTWDRSSNFKETIINASSVYAQKFSGLAPEHELYINSSNYDLYKIANAFIDKCTEMDLPYYFKLSEQENCDNKITIYSDSKNLPRFIEVLSQIEKQYPKIIQRCGEPPIISGQITKWLGYGKASVSLSGKLDYLSRRIKIIEKSLDQELRAWYKENKDQMTITDRNNKSISLTEYLSIQISKNEINKMLNCLPKSDYEKQNNLKKYGYTEKTLENPENKKKICSIILKEMTSILDDYSNGRELTKNIVISFSNGEKHTIPKYRILDEIKKTITMVKSVDENFARNVQGRIIENSKQEGIDPNNYCFNQQKKKTPTPNKKSVVLEQLQSTKKLAQEFGCQNPREPKENETVEEYSIYLKLYCTKILKPAIDRKKLSSTEKSSNQQKAYKYQEMTSEEIAESRQKLGFAKAGFNVSNKSQQQNPEKKSSYQAMTPEEISKSQEKIAIETSNYKSTNASRHYMYHQMTDEEIVASRQKIGEYIPPKQKRK